MNCIRETVRYITDRQVNLTLYVPHAAVQGGCDRTYMSLALYRYEDLYDMYTVFCTNVSTAQVELLCPYPKGFHAWRDLE